jgi:ketosteroid isomerase-like protein
MSRENVELVRGIVEAWLRGDFEGALARIAGDIEWEGPPDVSGGGRSYRGHEEMGDALGTWVGTWDDYHYELRNLLPAGDEVLVEGWHRGRGKGSGVEVSEAIYMVWTVRDGMAVRQRMFRDRAQALEAAGLSD